MNNYSSNNYAGVVVAGTADFEISYQETLGSFSLNVANVGVNPASAVTINLPRQKNFSSTGSGGFGGVLGIIFGVLISVIISAVSLRAIGPGGAMNAVVTPELLVFALAFSVFVGIISGVAPARSAAKMNPVDALRFEQ